MAITVKHLKVSTIPDSGDDTLIEPSDWNNDHVLTGTVPVANGGTGAATLTGYVKGNGTSNMTASSTIPNTDVTGLGTMSTQNANNVSITGGSISGATVSGYIPTTEKATANGVATLDGSGTVPISQLPAAVLGALSYQGTWNANTNTPTLVSSSGTKGYYYVVSVAGSTNLNGITDWQVGDWAVFNGTAWQKIDNTDAVTSVNGYTGTVVLTNTDISGFGTMSTQNANSVAITGGTIDGTTIGGTTPAVITGSTINANTKVVSPDYYAQSVLGGNLRTYTGTSLVNWDGGGSGNVTINGGLLASPANKNVTLSPSGTGTVTINPATAGAIDNMVIGATTPKAITGTTVTATTFSGSGASLTSIPNSALVNSAITINGVSTALGGSASVGTVTSVAATAGTGISVSGSPITGSGTLTITNTAPDQTVALTSGTGISVTGTYPNFTVTNTAPSSGGTVTSVTGTAPISSSGGNTPAISISQATTSTNGYLSSTDWNTFNNKQPAGSYLTAVTADAPLTGSGTSASHLSIPAATTSVNGYLTSTDWNTFNGKAPAVTYTTNYIPFGQGTTTPNQSANLQWDGSTLRAGSNALLGGTTNPIAGFTGSTNNYIQGYMYNANNGTSASSDFVAYTNNSTDAHGWADMGFTSQTYADSVYTVTGPNEAYLFGSAPSGSGKTGNLVYATDSTGTANVHQFYVGGFTQAKSAWKAQIDTTGLKATQLNATNGIICNSKSIAASFTIASGDNAMSTGPVTVASGQAVTISSGSRWVVL